MQYAIPFNYLPLNLAPMPIKGEGQFTSPSQPTSGEDRCRTCRAEMVQCITGLPE
jgi:hypothetical protein